MNSEIKSAPFSWNDNFSEEALSKVGIVGEWIEFTFKGEKPLHLMVKEDKRRLKYADQDTMMPAT